MNYNEYVQDFLDGTLEGHKEEEFFLALSSSDELRRELKQQFAIKEAIRSDNNAFTPKTASTALIFGTLGFSSPGSTPLPASKVSIIQKVGSYLKPYSQAVYGGLTAAAATVVVMLLLLDPFGNIDNKTTKNVNELSNFNHNNSALPVISDTSGKSLPIVSSFDGNNAENNDKSITETKTVIKYVYLNTKEKENKSGSSDIARNDNTMIQADNTGEIGYNTLLERDLNFINNASSPSKYSREFPNININGNLPYYGLSPFQIEEKLGFSVEFRGSQYWFFATENIHPEKYQVFNNVTLAAYYELFDEFLFGLDYRRENFYQKYEGINRDGFISSYEQQPNFSSYTVVARYLPKYTKISFVSPFIQAAVGGTKAGFIGRAMLGAELSPYQNFAFTVGAEGSVLRFQHNDYYFYSPKYGLSFGVRVMI